jgi:hypothetical protein
MTEKNYLNSCLLVVGRVQTSGCIRYTHTDRTETVEGAAVKSDWHTHKVIGDVEEQNRLVATRAGFLRKLTSLGTELGGFGVIIPAGRAGELENVMREIKQGVKEYNASARVTRIWAWFTTFQIRSRDEQIAAALYDKGITLLNSMMEAVQTGDVRKLRDCLYGLRGMDAVLPEEEGRRLGELISNIRKVAKEAVKQTRELEETEAQAAIGNALRGMESNVNGVRETLLNTYGEIEGGNGR